MEKNLVEQDSAITVPAGKPYEIITNGPPIVIDRTSVANRGEPLHEILWQGHQWSVTEYGIEARDGTYAIAADRLSETRLHQGHELPDWPLHMAEKDWVDIHDFCTAFLAALACYPEFAKFNGTQIRESIHRATIEASAGEKIRKSPLVIDTPEPPDHRVER